MWHGQQHATAFTPEQRLAAAAQRACSRAGRVATAPDNRLDKFKNLSHASAHGLLRLVQRAMRQGALQVNACVARQHSDEYTFAWYCLLLWGTATIKRVQV